MKETRIFRFALATMAALGLLAPRTEFAATLVVRNLNDDGPDSLRQLIRDAANGDNIEFADTATGLIKLDSGALTIDKDLGFFGPLGSGELGNLLSRVILAGNGRDRIFNIEAGKSVTIVQLVIFGGKAVGANGAQRDYPYCYGENGQDAGGGGIYNAGYLLLGGCTLIGNSAIGGNGASAPFCGGEGGSERGGHGRRGSGHSFQPTRVTALLPGNAVAMNRCPARVSRMAGFGAEKKSVCAPKPA